MAQEDKTSKATGFPGWLIGIFWSIVGVIVAVLTIIILTAYFLWLVLWGTGLSATPANQSGVETTDQATPAGETASASGQTLIAAQAATATAAQLSGTPAPGSTASQGSGETPEQEAPADAAASTSDQTPTAEQTATVTAAQLGGTAASSLTPPASDQPAPTSATSQREMAAGATPGAGAADPGESEGGGSSGGAQSETAGTGGQSPQPEQTGVAAAAEQDDQSGDQSSGVSSAPTGEPTTIPSPTATPSPTSTPTNTSTPTPTNTPLPSTNTPAPTSTSTPTPISTNTPSPTPTLVPPEPESQDYIVQTDDSLSRLAAKFYDNPLLYPAIVAATNAKAAEDDTYTFISDPDVIDVGQKLRIPTLAEAEILLADGEE